MCRCEYTDMCDTLKGEKERILKQITRFFDLGSLDSIQL